jgi:hypothetical protein
MYKALRQEFYWIGMKREIERYTRLVKSARKTRHLKEGKKNYYNY